MNPFSHKNKHLSGSDPAITDFILDKYSGLAGSSSAGSAAEAGKIEEQVFTSSFLLKILNGDDSQLKIKLLRIVPHHLFAGIMDQITVLLEQGELYDIDLYLKIPLIHAYRPEKVVSMLYKQIEQEKTWDPIIGDFYWLSFFDFLPVLEQKEWFQDSLLTFNGHQHDIKENPDAYTFLSGMVKPAIKLKHPDTAHLVKHFLEFLIEEGIEEEDLDEFYFKNLCKEFLDTLIPDARFELDLYFVMDYWGFDNAPQFLNHFYKGQKQGDALFQIFKQLLEYEIDSPENLVLSCLDEMENDFMAKTIRTLIEDQKLKGKLDDLGLLNDILAVFVSIAFQERRKKKTDIDAFSDKDSDKNSDKDIQELIIFDSRYIPFASTIKEYLLNMEKGRAEEFLNSIQDKLIANPEYDLAYSHGNLIKYMDGLEETAFTPAFFKGLKQGCEKENSHLVRAACKAFIRLEDAGIDYLSVRMDELQDNCLIELLDIIAGVDSEKAENLLIENFDLFIEKDRISTLDACESLLSLKALELLDNKVGKNQTRIDRLFVLANMLNGRQDNRTAALYQSLKDSRAKHYQVHDNDSLDNDSWDEGPQTLNLELRCPKCGDVSEYECANIYFAENSPPFVADELECIVCHQKPVFQVTVNGMIIIQMEFIRLMTLGMAEGPEPEEYDFQNSPLNLTRSKTLGKEMPLADGIELYNQRIIKNPKDPSNYIGLGNIYKNIGRSEQAETMFKKAIACGVCYIEAYMSLSELARQKNDLEKALDWLEKGRPFLKRPIICKSIDLSPEDIYDNYLDEHHSLLIETKSRLSFIQPSECISPGKSLTKIGRNEKCPCGSGKKYKKCCMKK